MSLCVPQSVSRPVSLRAVPVLVCRSQSVCQCVRVSGCPSVRLFAAGQALPRPRLQGNPRQGCRGRGPRLQVPTCPRRAGGTVASRGGGAWDPPGGGGAERSGAGRGGRQAARDPPGGQRRGANHMRAGVWQRRQWGDRYDADGQRPEQRRQEPLLQLERGQPEPQQQQQPRPAAFGGRALLKEAARPRSLPPPARSCPRGEGECAVPLPRTADRPGRAGSLEEVTGMHSESSAGAPLLTPRSASPLLGTQGWGRRAGSSRAIGRQFWAHRCL